VVPPPGAGAELEILDERENHLRKGANGATGQEDAVTARKLFAVEG
jgi:hypothetical protein